MAASARRAPREDLAPVILKEAAVLFADRGFEASTMQDIASRVGITAAGLYYHFPSKQALLFEVLDRALETLVAREAAAAERTRDAGVVAQLRALTRVHVSFQIEEVEESAVYGAAFYGSKHTLNALTDEQRGRLKELQNRSFNLLRGILQHGIDTGEFQVADVTLTTFAIIGIGEYVPSWFNPGGRLTSEAVAGLYADLATRMAGVRAG